MPFASLCFRYDFVPIFELTIDTRIERREARDLLWDKQEEILVANEAFPS